YLDHVLIRDLNRGYPVMDIIVESSEGPFATEDVLDKIKNTGIKDLNSNLTVKALSIPWTIGINISPHYHRHKFGLFAGMGLGYYSFNNQRDFILLNYITLKDDTVYNGVILSLNTELKHFNVVDHFRLSYSYVFEDFEIGLRFNRFGVIMDTRDHILDTSFFIN
ncbi:hypothetical protein RZS08_65585, partial [Arthrospira platensis SPKY1]|nr:hypothetical protein [Arthrospira platensis SPKY1]